MVGSFHPANRRHRGPRQTPNRPDSPLTKQDQALAYTPGQDSRLSSRHSHVVEPDNPAALTSPGGWDDVGNLDPTPADAGVNVARPHGLRRLHAELLDGRLAAALLGHELVEFNESTYARDPQMLLSISTRHSDVLALNVTATKCVRSLQ